MAKSSIASNIKVTSMPNTKALNMQERSPLDVEKYSDIIVRFGHRQVFAHKVYLARHSMYFSRAFESNFSVASSKIIDLGDDDKPELVMAMLRYIYDGADAYEKLRRKVGKVEARLDFNIDMFMMGDKYDMITLRQQAVEDWNRDAQNWLNKSSPQSTRLWDTINAHVAQESITHKSPPSPPNAMVRCMQRICGPDAVAFADKSLQDKAVEFCSNTMSRLLKDESFSTALKQGSLFDTRFTALLLDTVGRQICEPMNKSHRKSGTSMIGNNRAWGGPISSDFEVDTDSDAFLSDPVFGYDEEGVSW